MNKHRKSKFTTASIKREKPIESTNEFAYDELPRKVRRKLDRSTDPNFVYTYTDMRGEIVTVDIPNPKY